MKRLVLLAVLTATGAAAQDSSFTALRVRGSVFRLPVIGHFDEDWRARTGGQVEVASNVGRSEIALSVGRMSFEPTTGRPPFKETLISLALTRTILHGGLLGIDVGTRLTDVRMDFDDPALVGGLRNEEEQLFSALARGRIVLWRGYSGFVEGSYGMLMTSTRTPTATIAVGLQRDGTMPRWLRDRLQ